MQNYSKIVNPHWMVVFLVQFDTLIKNKTIKNVDSLSSDFFISFSLIKKLIFFLNFSISKK